VIKRRGLRRSLEALAEGGICHGDLTETVQRKGKMLNRSRPQGKAEKKELNFIHEVSLHALLVREKLRCVRAKMRGMGGKGPVTTPT